MLRIEDFIRENENVKVRIDEAPTMEDIGIFNKTLYEGLLYDVPLPLREREVVRSGFALGAKINCLYVLKEGK